MNGLATVDPACFLEDDDQRSGHVLGRFPRGSRDILTALLTQQYLRSEPKAFMENVWAQLPSPCLHEGRTISYQLSRWRLGAEWTSLTMRCTDRFRSFVARCFCKDEFLQVVELHRSGVPEVASSWRTDFAYIIGGHAEFSNDAPEAIGSFILNLLQEEHANNVAVLLTQWRGVESLTPSRRVELALMSCCPVLQGTPMRRGRKHRVTLQQMSFS